MALFNYIEMSIFCEFMCVCVYVYGGGRGIHN